MKKKLLTAAVGMALAAGLGAAQADVKVYGVAHLSLDMLDRNVSTDKGDYFLSSNSSRIGFSASEDLGGGLKALFGAEWQYTMDVGATNISNRDVTVGLQGGFGTIRLGNADDVVKKIGRRVDLFYSEQLGESRAITRTGTGNTTEERIANAIFYSSPKLMDALTLHAEVGVEDSFTSDNRTYALGGMYAAGPLFVGAAYKKVERTAPLNDTSIWRLSGQYKMADWTFSALYQSVSDVNGVSGADRDAYGVGVAYKFGNNTVKAAYYIADDLGSSSDTGAKQLSLGLDHNLSKNTIVYVTYAKTDNDANTNAFGIGGNGHGESAAPTTNGESASGFSIGMRMAF